MKSYNYYQRAVFIVLLISGMLFSSDVFAQVNTYTTISDISYYPDNVKEGDDYMSEQCLLDLYYPTDKKEFATVVWFHGGGLTGGKREIPEGLKNQGFAIVGATYRLAPHVKSPTFIEDAAAAVAWVFENIKEFGGDPSKIIISGSSAGGYLALMVGLDKQYLAKHEIDANDIAGLVPFTGHTITHFTIRAEKGIGDKQPVVDEYAPLFHVRADAPPLLLITGDRELEMLGRYEENAYLARMMKVAGHKETRLLELQGYGHNMVYPGLPLLVKEVDRLEKLSDTKE